MGGEINIRTITNDRNMNRHHQTINKKAKSEWPSPFPPPFHLCYPDAHHRYYDDIRALTLLQIKEPEYIEIMESGAQDSDCVKAEKSIRAFQSNRDS